MKPVDLCSQRIAALRLAKWWNAQAKEKPNEDFTAEIEVREDVIFEPDKWLSMGKLSLKLPPRINDEKLTDDQRQDREDHISSALLDGGYEWGLPEANAIQAALVKVVSGKENDKSDPSGAAARVRDAIAYALLRLGLEMPILDAQDLAKLPYRRPVTLVADTNAVLQGGVDFTVRFLYPMARLRIPEPVHAELSNQAVSYFSSRRSGKDTDKVGALNTLRQRLTSQGGLRALLRVQLQSGVEIERLQVEAEQPRNFDITGKDKGGDRSAVPDRMILEAAMRHQALISPSHPVRIMTADQGLARSALIEGIAPLYFPPRNWEALFGRFYLGSVLAPLPNLNGSVWHRVSLTEILWELAACFGHARLRLRDKTVFTIVATRGDLAWSPFHSREDLLWADKELDEVTATIIQEPKTVTVEEQKSQPKTETTLKIVAPKFSAEKLLLFLQWLTEQRNGSLEQAAKALDVAEKTARDYVRLLANGKFLKEANDRLEIDGESCDPLWTALRASDWDSARQSLLKLPALAALYEEVTTNGPVLQKDIKSIREGALFGFQVLGEICGAILNIPEIGICSCDPRPGLSEFCVKALRAYDDAIREDSSAKPLVQSGKWLELLASKQRIHPLFVPSLIQEAMTARRLAVVFEGSLPYRKEANHSFRRLIWRKGEPVLEETPLYRGDYLGDRASIHLKIEASNT